MPGPTPDRRIFPRDEAPADVPVFDRAAALHHVGDEPAILRQLLEMFLEQGTGRMAAVEKALAEGDGKRLEFDAHALKGTAATLGMPRLRDTAYSVERLGAQGNLTMAAAAVREMRAAMDEVVEALKAEMAS